MKRVVKCPLCGKFMNSAALKKADEAQKEINSKIEILQKQVSAYAKLNNEKLAKIEKLRQRNLWQRIVNKDV